MLYHIHTIVAGIESPADDPVLSPALDLARRCNADLHFVHAPELSDLVPGDGAPVDAPFHLDDRVAYHAVPGPPGRAILSVAASVGADLIIVGASPRRRIATVFGTTARRVAREAGVPVLVLRGHAPQAVSRVLLTTDLSPLSASTHEIALDIVDTLFPGDDVLIRAVGVVFDDPSLAPPFRGTIMDDVAREQLDAFLAERRERDRTVEPSVRFGDPVSEITDEVERWRADLVAVGSHGRTGAARVVMGSTAEGVLAHAPASVLMIPRAVVDHATVPAARIPAPTALKSVE